MKMLSLQPSIISPRSPVKYVSTDAKTSLLALEVFRTARTVVSVSDGKRSDECAGVSQQFDQNVLHYGGLHHKS